MFAVYWGGTVINAGPSPSSGNRQHPDNIPFLPPTSCLVPGLGWAGWRQKMIQGPRCQGHRAAATQPAAAHNSSSADTDIVTLVNLVILIILVIRVTLATMIQELLIVLMFKFMRASKHLQTELGPRTIVPHNHRSHSSGQRPITSPCLHSSRGLLLCCVQVSLAGPLAGPGTSDICLVVTK